VSEKRVQAVLTYAELNELIGGTERGRIEAVVADPIKRRVQIIFSAPGSTDGIEPWVVPFYALRSSSPPTNASAEVDKLKRRLQEVDYIVGNEDSLDSEACAALRAVIFDIPDPRRPGIPDAVETDPADYASPPSTHTSEGSSPNVEGGEQMQ
jgi:hypothetical protein